MAFELLNFELQFPYALNFYHPLSPGIELGVGLLCPLCPTDSKVRVGGVSAGTPIAPPPAGPIACTELA